MKYHIILVNIVLILFIILNKTIELELGSRIKSDLNQNNKEITKDINNVKKDNNSKEEVIDECWVHYFDFKEDSEIPQKFHKNEIYEEQQNHIETLNEKYKVNIYIYI